MLKWKLFQAYLSFQVSASHSLSYRLNQQGKEQPMQYDISDTPLLSSSLSRHFSVFSSLKQLSTVRKFYLGQTTERAVWLRIYLCRNTGSTRELGQRDCLQRLFNRSHINLLCLTGFRRPNGLNRFVFRTASLAYCKGCFLLSS